MSDANSEPTSRIRLTPNESFNTRDWQRYEGDVVIYSGGLYQLLIAWKDHARAINNNPLAVDSITIAPKVAYHVYDTICQDQRYNGYGFTLYPTETTQGGVITRGRYVTSATNPDSFLVLNLMVTPNVINYIYDSICTGEIYTKYGFTESQTGTYTRNYITRHGCDSSVVLELTVNPIVTNIQNDGACQSDMPFEWRGRTITRPGNYTDTLVATTGCDSLIMLSFAIYPEYEEHETHAIYQSELPYTHLDTTFQTNTPVGNTSVVLHRTTQFGCDSIVHFTLMVVKDTKVEEVMNTDFTLYPNPIALNQEVMINSTVYQGAFTIEVVNSASQVVYTKQYEQCPVRLNCFHTSGVYLIRLITADQKQYHFKLVVK